VLEFKRSCSLARWVLYRKVRESIEREWFL
jgi:hypothetical protein